MRNSDRTLPVINIKDTVIADYGVQKKVQKNDPQETYETKTNCYEIKMLFAI